jgi:hypothetical protein
MTLIELHRFCKLNARRIIVKDGKLVGFARE